MIWRILRCLWTALLFVFLCAVWILCTVIEKSMWPVMFVSVICSIIAAIAMDAVAIVLIAYQIMHANSSFELFWYSFGIIMLSSPFLVLSGIIYGSGRGLIKDRPSPA